VNLLDFRNDVDGARGTINQWVESKTEERIKTSSPKDLSTL
jgi:serine protease inhibitor